MEPGLRIWFRVGLFLSPELILLLHRARGGIERRSDSADGGALIGLDIFRKPLRDKPDHDSGITSI
jgi:hypothetical protein